MGWDGMGWIGWMDGEYVVRCYVMICYDMLYSLTCPYLAWFLGFMLYISRYEY